MKLIYPSDKPFLSIIIPAHNESIRLPRSLESIRGFVSEQPYQSEVLVVENGSTDNTAEIAAKLLSDWPAARLIQLEGSGKGLAVKAGMLAATGYYRFMMDADLSMSVDEINKFLPPRLDVPVAIASREAHGAQRFNEPPLRHFIGRMFNTLVRTIVLPGLQDSQCGFKCFSAEAAERIFPLQTFTGWSFDVEVLAIACELGFELREVPIHWTYQPGSRLSVFKDSLRMARELFEIRSNVKHGIYRASKA
jgi:glycosyltransferase involved in cell wall biosynthesis